MNPQKKCSAEHVIPFVVIDLLDHTAAVHPIQIIGQWLPAINPVAADSLVPVVGSLLRGCPS